MTNLLQRSFLLTIGAAALTKDMAEAFTDELVQKGQEASGEGKKAVDDYVEKAREEARSFRGAIDRNMKKTLEDVGVPTREQFEELKLKVAQLEHRISLLEKEKLSSSSPTADPEREEQEEAEGE